MKLSKGSIAAAFLASALWAPAALAGFPGTDIFIPAVARTAGAGGSQFYSTLWVTNVGTANATFQIQVLRQGMTNPTPLTKTENLGTGATRRYDNIMEYLGTAGGAALHIVSNRELLVSSRTYDLQPGAPLKNAKGLFFAGIPAAFAIGNGQSAYLQGVTNGPLESYRYNFGIVETTGQNVTVEIDVLSQGGNVASKKTYDLGPYEARQVNAFQDFIPPVSTTNAIIEATVTGGTGKVIVYGTQIAGTQDDPGSNDSIGFEMTFRDELLAP